MKVAVSKDRAAFFISFYQIIQVYNRLKRYRVYIETAGDESAVVDNTGKVSVLSYNEETAGKVTITASVDGVNYSCEIEVKKPEMNKKSVVVKQVCMTLTQNPRGLQLSGISPTKSFLIFIRFRKL